MTWAGRLLAKITRFNRRYLTGGPTGVTPDAHLAWVQEQVKAYATVQPYAGPLSSGDDNLTGETWEMRLAYRRMLKEPAVKAPLLKKVFAVASLDAQVIPEDKKSPTMVAAARWMDTAVKRMPGGWPQLLLNVMLPGLVDGFSLAEKVFDVVPADDPRYPRFWTVRACKSKDTKFVRFKLDPYKNVVAVQAMAAGQGGQPLDPGDFLHFTFLKVFESPFGMSDLRACYRGAMLIESAVKLRAVLLENYSGPYLAAKYQAGDTAARDQIGAILAAARARGYVVLPDGADLQVMNLATSSPDQFQDTIEDLRKEIALSLQGAYLDQVESKTPQGNSETHKTVAELFQWYLSVVVASTVTEQLGPDLVGPNYGAAGGRPTVVLGGIDPDDVIANGRRIEQAQKIGLPVSQEYAYEIMQVEPPRDPADVLKPARPTPAIGPGGPGGGGGGVGATDPGRPAGAGGGPPTRAFAEDAAGHEHRGKGPGGGQFVGKGEGGGVGKAVRDHLTGSGTHPTKAVAAAATSAVGHDRAAVDRALVGLYRSGWKPGDPHPEDATPDPAPGGGTGGAVSWEDARQNVADLVGDLKGVFRQARTDPGEARQAARALFATAADATYELYAGKSEKELGRALRRLREIRTSVELALDAAAAGRPEHLDPQTLAGQVKWDAVVSEARSLAAAHKRAFGRPASA